MTYSYDRWKPLGLAHTDFTGETASDPGGCGVCEGLGAVHDRARWLGGKGNRPAKFPAKSLGGSSALSFVSATAFHARPHPCPRPRALPRLLGALATKGRSFLIAMRYRYLTICTL